MVFSTHGHFGKDLPGITVPVLILCLVPPGADGFLGMIEITSFRLKAHAVALTACQAGLGRHVSGEGAMGMGAGLPIHRSEVRTYKLMVCGRAFIR